MTLRIFDVAAFNPNAAVSRQNCVAHQFKSITLSEFDDKLYIDGKDLQLRGKSRVISL